MYTKIIQRSVLIVVAVLFIVPLAVVIAQAVFPPTSDFPILQRGFYENNWVLKDARGAVIDKNPKTGIYLVARNTPITLSWDAKAPVCASDDVIQRFGQSCTPDSTGVKGGAGIFCTKNWMSGFSPSGTFTGTLLRDRVFQMTCSGVGGGILDNKIVKVGVVDLTVSALSLGNLSPNTNTTATNDYFVLPLTVNVTVKNSGTISSPPFRVEYAILQGNNTPQKITKSVESIAGPGTQTLEELPTTPSAGVQDAWNYFVCVDPNNTIVETNEDNNCADIGPYYFTNPR